MHAPYDTRVDDCRRRTEFGRPIVCRSKHIKTMSTYIYVIQQVLSSLIQPPTRRPSKFDRFLLRHTHTLICNRYRLIIDTRHHPHSFASKQHPYRTRRCTSEVSGQSRYCSHEQLLIH